MNLTFDEATHTYRCDGQVLVSVTQVLKAEGFIDTTGFNEYTRDRGVKAHRAIELYDADELDEDSLDLTLRPYLDAWIKFKTDTKLVIGGSEVVVASLEYGCAGRIDKLAMLNGSEQAVLDIKTGVVRPWTALQLAGYLVLLGDPVRKRYAVQLSEDGKYKLHEFKDRSDRGVFLAALTVHNWKRREMK